jgi:glycosyltransferase involved in cell wall biosynthesis
LAAGGVVLDDRSDTCLQTVLPSGKLKKIPNMIDIEDLDGIAKQKFSAGDLGSTPRDVNLVFVGHVVLEKGVIEFVQACAQLSNIQLRLVGPVADKFRTQLERLALNRRKEQWLLFYSAVNREEACRQLLLSDILLLPSHAEAFPLTLLEGMAFSKPVVITEIGIMSEMILAYSEGSCGLCVAPQNTDSLHAGLGGVLEHPDVWRELGRRGLKCGETFYEIKPVMQLPMGLWRKVAD